MRYTVPLLTIAALIFLASCSSNRSVEHARSSVDALRRFESEARAGVPIGDLRKTYSEAAREFRRIDPGEVDEYGVSMLELSLLTHEMMIKNEHASNDLSLWQQAVESREIAARYLGVND